MLREFLIQLRHLRLNSVTAKGGVFRAIPDQSHATNRFAYLANSPPADYG